MPGLFGDRRAAARHAWRRRAIGRRFRRTFGLLARRVCPSSERSGEARDRLTRYEAAGGAVASRPTRVMADPVMAAGRDDHAFVARMRAGGGEGWPEAMKRELQACRSAGDWRAWSEKWALVLSGETQRDGPTRPAGHPQPL